MFRFLLLFAYFSFNVHADDSPLNNAISNYIFDMTVEWNQQDEIYAHEKLQSFQEAIHHLVKNGLNPNEVEARLKKVNPTGASWGGKIKWHPRSYLFTVLTITLVIALSYNDNSDPVCSVGGNWVELKCDEPGNCYHYFHETCE